MDGQLTTGISEVIVKGFFFDLDGTLVDTLEANVRAYRQAAEEVAGVTLGNELRDLIKGGGASVSFLPKLIPAASDADIAAINSRKKELYPDHLDASTLNGFLSSFLEQMSEHYVTALLTTAKRPNALAVLKKHDLEKRFDFMIFGDDVENMKPDPEVYNLALEKSGLKKEEVIAFEDSPKGLEAAERAGIQTIHIRNFL